NANYKGLFSRDDYPSTPRHQTTIYLTPSDKLACYVATGDGLDGGSAPNFDGSGSTTFSTATWYHVVCTYDATNGLIGYVNGSADATGAINLGAIQTGAAKVAIGKDVLGESIGGADRFY